MRVAILGTGKMGGAMLSGWLAQGLDPRRIAVIEPSPSVEITALSAKGVRFNLSPADAGAVAAVVVAVKPQSFGEVAATLQSYTGSDPLVVSIMAGTTIVVDGGQMVALRGS